LGFQGFGFRIWGFGFRVSGFGFRVSGFGSWGSGFRVSGLGFGVQGLGFRVSGSGFRVETHRPRTGSHPGGNPGANLKSISQSFCPWVASRAVTSRSRRRMQKWGVLCAAADAPPPPDPSDRTCAQISTHYMPSALEATQGQMDGFFIQPRYKCHIEEVASAADSLKICLQLDSRVVVPSRS
jgi:hypothetical protein